MSTPGMMPAIETAVRALAANFSAAWNRHDAKALAALFVEDGDLINPAGRVANGRSEIEALMGEEQSRMFASSKMTMNVTGIRVLTPEIVVATSHCDIAGVRNPSTGETGDVNAIATMVLRGDEGQWRIVVGRPMVPVSREPR